MVNTLTQIVRVATRMAIGLPAIFATRDEDELLFNAMCLWEAYLDCQDNYPEIKQLQGSIGISELRSAFADRKLLSALQKGWQAAHQEGKGFDYPFDLEFCSLFLNGCVVVENNSLLLAADWEKHCRELGVNHG